VKHGLSESRSYKGTLDGLSSRPRTVAPESGLFTVRVLCGNPHRWVPNSPELTVRPTL